MADWGGIAAGADEGLQQVLARRLQEQEMQRQAALDAERQRQFDAQQMQEREMAALAQERERVRVAQDAKQFAARSAQAERGLDLEAQGLGQRKAEFAAEAPMLGLKIMEAERALMPEERDREHNQALARIKANRESLGNSAATRYVTRTWTDPATGQAMTQTMTAEEAAAMGPVPAVRPSRATTGAERSTFGFAQRMQSALQDIEPIEEQIAQQSIAGQLQGKFAPNMFQTETQQLYRQAQRAFTEARLRKESGAAIPQSEFDNDARTYFAQPGDSLAVIEQKRQRRAEIVQSFIAQAPNAAREFSGQEQAAPQQERMVTIRNKRTGETMQVPASDPRAGGVR